jgi:lipopolysaccharide export LptBFGC system permease protein LptF
VFELHNRIGFSIAPLTFCAFALVLAIRRRAGHFAVVGAVSLTSVGYLMIHWLGNALSVGEAVSPQLGAWLPQIALILTTIAVGVPRTFMRRRA